MKRQIRHNVFETNSSSTHAICISKKDIDKENLPNNIEFCRGEFGWEFSILKYVWEKASYLYEAIYDCYDESEREDKINIIKDILDKYNINYVFDDTDKSGYSYIDHPFDTIEFINAVLEDEDKLLKYLFGDSIVITGNDNTNDFSDYIYYDYYNDYVKPEFKKYEIYLKGN